MLLFDTILNTFMVNKIARSFKHSENLLEIFKIQKHLFCNLHMSDPILQESIGKYEIVYNFKIQCKI